MGQARIDEVIDLPGLFDPCEETVAGRVHAGEELQEARVLASQMTAEREHWEHKVSLLRPEGIDPDMLEERARLLLNYLRDDEVVIYLPRK